MSEKELIPYADESTVLTIQEFTVENRLDRISLYGSLSLTKDKAGLASAKLLQGLLNSIVTTLESSNDLPDEISLKPVVTIANPFN